MLERSGLPEGLRYEVGLALVELQRLGGGLKTLARASGLSDYGLYVRFSEPEVVKERLKKFIKELEGLSTELRGSWRPSDCSPNSLPSGSAMSRKEKVDVEARPRVTDIPEAFEGMMLLGPPGIGKTEIVKSLAMEEARRLKKTFVDLREADEETLNDIFAHPEKYYVFVRVVAPTVFPEDVGMPKAAESYVNFIPPKALAILSIPNVHGLIFFDELTNVQRDDQISMYFSLILEKEAGFQLRLSRNVKVACAGNPPEWSEIVRPLPKPMRSGRVVLIEVDAPTIDEWIDYMNKKYGSEWETFVGAYLKFYPDDFLRPPTDDWKAWPSPRSWTKLATLLHKFRGSNGAFLYQLIVGSVGPEAGAKFWTLWKSRLNIGEVMERLKKEPELFAKIPTEQKILVLHSLSQQPVDVLKEDYEGLMKWLLDNERELVVLLFKLVNPSEKKLQLFFALQNIHPTGCNVLIEELKKYTHV